MSMYIEEKKRFSDSILWSVQREYYDKEGIDAWSEDVPFYVTSNPFIAHSYANVAVRFILDWIHQNPDAVHQPFYFMELGTGPGQFSFYVLKALEEILHKLRKDEIKIRYIMSDFTMKNIDFWKQHEKLRPYVERGILDFAQFDLENDTEIELQGSGVTLGRDSLENPLIIIANYIFDTLRTDVFTVKDGKLFESLVSLKSDKKNMSNGAPKNWEAVKVEHSANEINGNYYKNPHYNRVLKIYKEELTETHFLFPVVTLDALARLQTISDGKALILSSDKAYSTVEEQDNADYPEIAFHGSFSVMANFDAIARVFQASGGDALIQTPREGITTAVFASGIKFQNHPETSLALEQYVEGFSPGDYFVLHDQICNENKKIKLEVYASLLSMSYWDPYVYDLVCDRMIELLDEPDYDTLEYLCKKMHEVAKNFYYTPGSEDTLFNIGLFYHEAERYEEAIPYYESSIRLFGEQHVALYNLGICHYELQNLKKAQALLKHSIEIDPKQKDAKDWLKTVEKALKS